MNYLLIPLLALFTLVSLAAAQPLAVFGAFATAIEEP